MKAWKCNGCGCEPCILVDQSGSVNFPKWNIDCGPDKTKWKKTDEYEIVEKKKSIPGIRPESIPPVPECKPPKPETETPNCALCRWATKGTVNNGIFKSEKVFCKAQALKYADDVYGNNNCISLYERKEEKNK